MSPVQRAMELQGTPVSHGGYPGPEVGGTS